MNPRNAAFLLATLLGTLLFVWRQPFTRSNPGAREIGTTPSAPGSPPPSSGLPHEMVPSSAANRADAVVTVSTWPLSTEVAAFLAGTRENLGWAEIPVFRDDALEHLLADLETCEDPLKAARLAGVLARTVDVRVVRALIHKATGGFAGRQVSPDELAGVAALAGSLAFSAASDDTAYDFLVAATRPSFWDRTRRWRCREEDESAGIYLAGRCWQALGHSGRPGAYEYLLDHREGRRTLENPRLAAAVASAAFRYFRGDEIRHRRRPLMDLFDEWSETEEGVRWMGWVLQTGGKTVRSTASSAAWPIPQRESE